MLWTRDVLGSLLVGLFYFWDNRHAVAVLNIFLEILNHTLAGFDSAPFWVVEFFPRD